MKPRIICHMMSSVDGRLLPERYSQPFNGKNMNELMDQYFTVSDQFGIAAFIIGRKTLQEYFVPNTFISNDDPPAIDHSTYIGNRNGIKTAVVMDPSGRASYETQNGADFSYITILGEKVSDRYLVHLREQGISYLFAGANGDNLVKAMSILATEFGIRELLLEGGGIINGTFLNAGLIDELSLMIYPGIDGLSGSPSIFEYKGLDDELPAIGQSLEYVSTEVLQNGVVWIKYNFHK